VRIAVRCDGSMQIGTGHLHRCLSLANALTALGAEVRFVLRPHDAVAERIMATRPYPVSWLPPGGSDLPSAKDAPAHAAWAGVTEADDVAHTIAVLEDWQPRWVVVDHYAFGARWHRGVREALSCSILAIDDLADRALDADVVLDGNAADDHAVKYAGRLAPAVRMLAGPRYALIGESYLSAPRYVPVDQVRSIGVFMGGTDQHNASGAALDILRCEVGFAGPIEIVTTATAPHAERLSRKCADDGAATMSIDLSDLSAFFGRHDLQIGAGGTSSYERACIGAPTIAVVLAANQLAVVPILDRLGVVRAATIPGIAETGLVPGADGLAAVATALLAQPALRRAMAERARALVDGRGAQRVALSLVADTLALRSAVTADANLLHEWRNAPATRAVSSNDAAIAYDDHVKWMAAVLASPVRRLFVGMVGTLPVGAIRFDLNDQSAWEISLYTDPALHGLGLGSRMLAAGERAIMAEHASWQRIAFHAKVEAGNAPSARMFAKAGYRADIDWLVKVREREAGS
jgi:UDP-2,4-diacetamido-2,4,6-trideoxy-beta-L-altropyranose hydrolase